MDSVHAAVEDIEVDALNNEIQQFCVALLLKLRNTRKNLTADELCELKGRVVRLEAAIPEADTYFFVVDGTLNGVQHKGCIFAGNPMIVVAESYAAARDIAERGLADTVSLLFQHYMQLTKREASMIGRVAAGRKAPREERPFTDPWLRDIIATEIGGLPWKN